MTSKSKIPEDLPRNLEKLMTEGRFNLCQYAKKLKIFGARDSVYSPNSFRHLSTTDQAKLVLAALIKNDKKNQTHNRK